MKRIFLLFAIALLGLQPVLQAQELPGLKDAYTALNAILENGRKKPYSYEMKCVYTNESNQNVILDSLSGNMEISGNNVYWRMDRTETIHNDQYNILLFKNEKLIMISSAKKDTATSDPLMQLLNMMTLSGALDCNITRKGAFKTININFRPGSTCKHLNMRIDTVQQHLISVDYLIKSSMLMESSTDTLPEGYDEYAFVRATYFNYHNLPVSSTRFNNDQYFYKEGNEYKPAAAYSDYQVILATPNL